MKQKLLDILKKPNDQVICIDLDGTLCEGEFWGGEEPAPLHVMIEKVTQWYQQGAHIIIYTARQPKYFTLTQAWLVKWGVPFHGIAMQMKPGADVYIDDKSLHPEDL